MTDPVFVSCTGAAFHCHCMLLIPEGTMHEQPHRCCCGGSWRGEPDTDSFEVIKQPDLDFITRRR
jgi:hypothetical protein